MLSLPIKLRDCRDKVFIVKRAKPTGGKAGKGRNKTSTIQVYYGYIKVKQFRFERRSPAEEYSAIMKALVCM